jgi:DsbC/DsbD-like thiol-disulfide interchange protein
MNRRTLTLVVALAIAVAASAATAGLTASPQQPPDIGVDGLLATDKAPRGRTTQAAVVMTIPAGFHVNSNRPLGKYAIPTRLEIKAPEGIKVSPVIFPRPVVRKFKFSENRPMAVYEGRAVMRFNVTVPARYQPGTAELRATLRYQSCNDEVCFPPQTREITIPLTIADTGESVKRINGEVFGGKR